MPAKAKKQKDTKSTKVGSHLAQKEEVTPNWPPLHPLVPSSDLAIETLVENHIVLVRNFFTTKLCKDYVSFLSSLPLLTTPGKPKKGEAVRVNDRFQINDPVFAERLWSGTALQELISATEGGESLWGGQVVGLNPNIRIYRYRPGQFFAQHYDDFNLVTLPHNVTGPIPSKTTWTLLIYLTSPSTGCHGGETVFYPDSTLRSQPMLDPVAVGLETGMALLHRHGDHCMLHEGREVTAGEKWVIRSDLCVRR